MLTHRVDDWRGPVETPEGLAVFVTEGSALPEERPEEYVLIADQYCRIDGYDLAEDVGHIVVRPPEVPRLIAALQSALQRIRQQEAVLAGAGGESEVADVNPKCASS